MKNLFNLILFLIPICSVAQTKQDSINARITILTEKNNNNSITKEEKQDLLNYGYKLQNKGFYLDDYKHDYINAIPHIEKAIDFWISIKDTADEANLRKYLGYLYGNVGRFEEGKKEINKAINLFKEINRHPTYVNVCQYDLALLYDKENRLDSAIYYENIVNDFWISYNESTRIIASSTHLIDLYRKTKDYEKSENIQILTEQLPKEDFPWNSLIDFYYVSYKLYSEINQSEKANKYKQSYDSLKLNERNDKGVEISSKFE